MTKRNHRAASLKAWRTRRKMKQAREALAADYRSFKEEKAGRAVFGPEYLELIEALGKVEPREKYIDRYMPPKGPKREYRRVLPCPNFGSVR